MSKTHHFCLYANLTKLDCGTIGLRVTKIFRKDDMVESMNTKTVGCSEMDRW